MNVILTGASGFVGEGVLLECLENSSVSQILTVNRRPLAINHAKVTELVIPDFLRTSDYADALAGYDTCFFCSGISATGKSEDEYTRITYNTTLAFAEVVLQQNPDLLFEYVSGQLTDSTEQGRMMWARVKGRTENALSRLPFRHLYCIRPGLMRPTPGQQNAPFSARALSNLYPLLRHLFPTRVSTMRDVGLAMIRSAAYGYPKDVLEVQDINSLAQERTSTGNGPKVPPR